MRCPSALGIDFFYLIPQLLTKEGEVLLLLLFILEAGDELSYE
jgi:hypothetical protein